jgi:hypothetical protein
VVLILDDMAWGGARKGAGRPEKGEDRLDKQHVLRCTSAERTAWETAAKAEKKKLSKWMREKLNKAAK